MGLIIWQQRSAAQNQLRARVRELEGLSSAVATIAGSTLNEDALCKLVFEQVSQLMDASNFQLGTFEGNGYFIRTRTINGEPQPPAQFELRDGIVKWVREHGKPLLVNDFVAERDLLPAAPSFVYHGAPPRSGVFVPLMCNDAVLGAMALQSPKTRAYSQNDLRALSIIATQAASAIQNTRSLSNEQRRLQQLELVSEVANQTQSAFDLETMLPLLTQAVQNTFGYYFVAIFLVDADQSLLCRASHPIQQPNLKLNRGEGLIGACASEQHIIIVDDVSQDARFVSVEALSETRSEAVLPLVIEDQVVGVMDLQSNQRAGFSNQDQRFLNFLAQQVAIAIEDARLYETSLATDRLHQELEMAKNIQVSFLPQSLPRIDGWVIAGVWKSAEQVGGDFYDYFELDQADTNETDSQYRYGFVIADVAGKGMPAALFMTLSRTLMRSVAFTGRAPTNALNRVNDLIFADSRAEMFVTMAYAQLNPLNGHIELANAGHNPPLILRADGTIEQVACSGIALGIMDHIALTPCEARLSPGDVIIFYTDGITDALDSEQNEFGIVRLCEVIGKQTQRSADEIIESILDAINAHVGNEPTFDDQTMIVIKRK
jgi:sigma-B regulation protein RsbU (phosphoserine phosphatase)